MSTTTYTGTKSTTTISTARADRMGRKIQASKNCEARERAKSAKFADKIKALQERLYDLKSARDHAHAEASRAHNRTQHLESGCHECGRPFGLDEHASRWCINVPGTERLDDDGAAIPGTGDQLRTEDHNWALRCDPCHAASKGITLKALRAEGVAREGERIARRLALWGL